MVVLGVVAHELLTADDVMGWGVFDDALIPGADAIISEEILVFCS